MPSADNISTREFRFLEESPSSWSAQLKHFQAQGSRHLQIPIFWGAHESLRGIRDFTKSPKLRLEKLFVLLHELGMTCDLVFGFFPGTATFPDWTGGMSKTYVPARLWDGVSSGYALAEVPSICDGEVRRGFLEFFEQALSLSSLYQGAEGPVRQVVMDLGIFGSDLPATESPLFLQAFERRYPKVEDLNQRYQTNFRTLHSAFTKLGYRALSEKRGWLAAFDYKVCRRAEHDQFSAEATQVAKNVGIDSLIIAQRTPSDLMKPREWSLVLDGVLVESVAGEIIAPYNPFGVINTAAIMPFRLAEYLEAKAKVASISYATLPLWEGETLPLPSKLLVCATGRYLTQASLRVLSVFARSGGAIFFPMGAPQYDENLSSLAFPAAKSKIAVSEGIVLMVSIWEGGKILVPSPLFELHDSLWESISEVAQHWCQQAEEPC